MNINWYNIKKGCWEKIIWVIADFQELDEH